MISDATNHDQQCISNIDGGESLLKDEDFLFENGEEMVFDLDDLLAPLDCGSAWSKEELRFGLECASHNLQIV
ncbi:hypothetical protein ACFX13_029924 [Malus domestica]